MANPEHLAKLKEGVAAWNEWREQNPDIRPDLSAADLSSANLYAADLSSADLRGANLSWANLRGANLTDADVTNLRYLEPVRAPQSRFVGTLWQWMRTNLTYRRRVMRGRYNGIRGLSSCYGNRLFVRDAADQDYLDTIERQLRNWWGRLLFWCWGLTDYGRSFLSVVVLASILIFVFGGVYSLWPGMLSYGGRCPTGFTPYYFSIVTYTTLGFGDVKPYSLGGEILVSFEVILGYVTLGLLLAVLAEKIARRS